MSGSVLEGLGRVFWVCIARFEVFYFCRIVTFVLVVEFSF